MILMLSLTDSGSSIPNSNETNTEQTLEVGGHSVIFERVDFFLLTNTVSLHFVREERKELSLERFEFGAGEDKSRGGGGDKSDQLR